MKITTLAALCIGVAALSCSDNGNNPQPPKTFLAQDMKLTNNEIPGWSNKMDTIDNSVTPPIVDTGWNVLPDRSSLFIAINGGAKEYTDHGWVNGVEQKMDLGQDGPQYRGFIFNFGTADSAAAMFKTRIPADTTVDTMYAIPGFDKSVAFGVFALGGGRFFMHKNNLFFELEIIGYREEATAYPVASQFLNAYINKMK
jgi:hypothetical protein